MYTTKDPCHDKQYVSLPVHLSEIPELQTIFQLFFTVHNNQIPFEIRVDDETSHKFIFQDECYRTRKIRRMDNNTTIRNHCPNLTHRYVTSLDQRSDYSANESVSDQ